MLAEGVTGFRRCRARPLLKKAATTRCRSGQAPPGPAQDTRTVLTPLNAASSKAVAAEIRHQSTRGPTS